MTTYLRHALPWTALVACACLVVGCLAGVAWKPYQLWPLEGIAVGVLAATGAWSADEPLARVVDSAPRALWWRSLVRLTGLAAVAGIWLGTVGVLRDSLLGHAHDVAVQGIAALMLGFAFATWRRTRGVATPGAVFASLVVPAASFWALGGNERLPVFPYTSPHVWSDSRVLWMLVLGLALLRLFVDLTERLPRSGRTAH